MPVTEIDFPILQHFLCTVENSTGMPAQPLDAPGATAAAGQADKANEDGSKPKQLPKGVVLGPDGKPCRSCTSLASWMAMAREQDNSSPSSSSSSAQKKSTFSAAAPPSSLPKDCPPDVEQLGRSTWTLLHTITANYPSQPSMTQQTETRQFLGLFSKIYPCWSCAEDFRNWMDEKGNAPRVSSRDEFGRWMCEAHNAVNVKLGKKSFDCGRWEERWRTGWRDGSCG